MVCRLTIGKKKYKKVEEQIKDWRDKSEVLRRQLQEMIISDGQAFDDVMKAGKLPKDTDDEIKKRDIAIVEATKHAAEVPLETAKMAYEVLKLAKHIAENGNVNSVTDAGVAALMAKAALEGAIYNVKINISGFDDAKFVESMNSNSEELVTKSTILADEIKSIVESKIK